MTLKPDLSNRERHEFLEVVDYLASTSVSGIDLSKFEEGEFHDIGVRVLEVLNLKKSSFYEAPLVLSTDFKNAYQHRYNKKQIKKLGIRAPRFELDFFGEFKVTYESDMYKKLVLAKVRLEAAFSEQDSMVVERVKGMKNWQQRREFFHRRPKFMTRRVLSGVLPRSLDLLGEHPDFVDFLNFVINDLRPISHGHIRDLEKYTKDHLELFGTLVGIDSLENFMDGLKWCVNEINKE